MAASDLGTLFNIVGLGNYLTVCKGTNSTPNLRSTNTNLSFSATYSKKRATVSFTGVPDSYTATEKVNCDDGQASEDGFCCKYMYPNKDQPIQT